MKIDYDRYPVLKMLKSRNFNQVKYFGEDIDILSQIIIDYKESWEDHVNSFIKEIIVVTKPFLEAMDKSKESMQKLLKYEIDHEDISIKGTFIIGRFVIMVDYEKKEEVDMPEAHISVFDTDGVTVLLYISTHLHEDGYKEGIWISKSLQSISTYTDNEWVYHFLLQVLCTQLFKKYASVETKILYPNQKPPRDILCPYRNNTDFKITYLDSKWFTTLVRSEGFNVRGHFRLQPKKKDGEWTRELIWIDEFRKHGYTSHAKVLEYNES